MNYYCWYCGNPLVHETGDYYCCYNHKDLKVTFSICDDKLDNLCIENANNSSKADYYYIITTFGEQRVFGNTSLDGIGSSLLVLCYIDDYSYDYQVISLFPNYYLTYTSPEEVRLKLSMCSVFE